MCIAEASLGIFLGRTCFVGLCVFCFEAGFVISASNNKPRTEHSSNLLLSLAVPVGTFTLAGASSDVAALSRQGFVSLHRCSLVGTFRPPPLPSLRCFHEDFLGYSVLVFGPGGRG
jgi:hypothetical protein